MPGLIGIRSTWLLGNRHAPRAIPNGDEQQPRINANEKLAFIGVDSRLKLLLKKNRQMADLYD